MRTSILTSLAALGGVLLLLREAAPDAWALPVAARAGLLALLALALVQLVRSGGLGAARRWAGACLLVLAAAAALRFVPVRPDPDAWRAREESRLRSRFEAAKAALLGIESEARDLGREARRVLADSTASGAMTREAQARLFESLAPCMNRTPGARTPGIGPAGVQLFDARGELVAWAGAPHALETGTRLTRFAGGMHPLYFRRSGVYTVLSFELRDPPAPASGDARAPRLAARSDSIADSRGQAGALRVLVDVPVEVHYRISNRFLQSRSQAEDLSGDGIEVEFVYDAAAVPPYLTRVDLDLRGDEQRGMQGLGLVRDSSGVALAFCRLTGLSYRDAVETVTLRLDAAMRLLVLLGVVLGWTALWLGWRGADSARARRLAASPLLPIAALWSARLALAWLGLPSNRTGGALLNPATFAMVGFGGVLRSPLDLLLTALALAGTAGLIFVHAVRREATPRLGPAPRGLPAPAATLVAAAIVAAFVGLAFRFVGRVAADSNPHLLGPQLDLLSPAVACLHLGLLIAVASWLTLATLAAHATGARRGNAATLAAGAVAVTAGLAWSTSGVAALAGVVVLLGGLHLRALLTDERFTSFGLASFALVAITATIDSDALHREHFRANRARVEETAAKLLAPGDDLRQFVLDEFLQKVLDEPVLRQGLRAERPAQRSALAFELWAQSMLSHVGYSCEVRVFDALGQLASEFAVDMPPGPETSPRELLERARAALVPVTETSVEPAAAGPVRSYGGAVAVRGDGPTPEYLGAVVVALPFAPSSLELAANPRARTPEVLRNLQNDSFGPRVDDSERMLLAWIEGGFVVESSTPYLEVGQAPSRGAPGSWQRLRLVNGDYLVTFVPVGGRTLLAGFRLTTSLDRLLEWTQIGSFSFAVVMLVLAAFLGAVRLSGIGRHLPPLLVPKRLGFQQKLIVAFLVVALLPSVVLSVATRDIMRDRNASRNRDAALAKARAAEAALADLVRRDLDAVRESEYLRDVITAAESPWVRDIGHLEFSQIMVFHGDGRIILDETLSNLSDAQACAFVQARPGQVFASRDGRNLCLGALTKIWHSPTEGMSETAPDAQPYFVFYRRRLTDKLLRSIAPILSADISGFLGPHLVVSSQKSLATAGLLPSLVPPQAYTHVQLRRNRFAVTEESAGRQRYFASYLPLEDRAGERIGALAVSQLLQPDEFAVEVERTRDLVLGLSTLMFVLTLLLGVFFATRIFDPVRNLIEGTRRIAGGDLGFRLRARAGDEIGELERSFNEMSARLLTARGALEERRRYLEAVLGNIASGVVATDADGRVTAANPAAYRILRLTPGSLEGHTWAELAAASARRATAHLWRRLGEAPGGEVVEIPVYGPGAAPAGGATAASLEQLTLRVIVTDLVPVAGDPGARLGRVAIFEDVTELIRSKKLSAWAEMARQVAHEIKNPLTPMKLSAQFMEQAFHDKSAKFPQIFQEGMATIIQQVESLKRIATEFSSFGRVQKLRPQPLDLGELLQSVTAPYRKIEGLELEVCADVPGDAGAGEPAAQVAGGGGAAAAHLAAGGLRVLGDAEGLRKVFRNVLENAREAMGGRGRITLRVERSGPDRVQVHITDHGAGIPEDAALRLFEPYFSTKSTGTGLGLAISRSILEELGGSITLANRTDGGAEACITLVPC